MFKEEIVRIGIEGSTSVGKTTALEVVSNLLLNNSSLAISPEAARIFFTQHSEITDRGPEVQAQLVPFVREQEDAVAMHTGAEILLCDRTTLSPAVHAFAAGENEVGEELWQKGDPQRYSEILLFSPQGVPYEPDPLRLQTPAERLALHEAYGQTFEEKGVSFSLVEGSLAERVLFVAQTIVKHVPENPLKQIL